MFEYVEQHDEIKYVVVNELERLTAGISQRAKVTSVCKRLGITLLTEDMGLIDPHDEDKMHEADQRAVASAGEVFKIRRRTRRALRQKARNGVSIMRPPTAPACRAAGWWRSTRTSTRGSITMFDWAAAGVSLGEIVRRLDAGASDQGRQAPLERRCCPRNPGRIRSTRGEMTWGRRRTLRDEDGRKYREAATRRVTPRSSLASRPWASSSRSRLGTRSRSQGGPAEGHARPPEPQPKRTRQPRVLRPVRLQDVLPRQRTSRNRRDAMAVHVSHPKPTDPQAAT